MKNLDASIEKMPLFESADRTFNSKRTLALPEVKRLKS